jgi:hypothetical protein
MPLSSYTVHKPIMHIQWFWPGSVRYDGCCKASSLHRYTTTKVLQPSCTYCDVLHDLAITTHQCAGSITVYIVPYIVPYMYCTLMASCRLLVVLVEHAARNCPDLLVLLSYPRMGHV